ncbi:alpha/beta hydrolase [Roseospirillum parvum]|uniref:Lysophospholipase, alpha-beta hydrolase superfamily n=1 Tax=Roseospirillum parvum TaxID=83401 RepID=A0A1G7TUQ8_9PROT|nr:alpha/beta hydrolase [Roseospirillum parvum]SDG38469.1 Lysophospholipase, alpha-beta hydrolase superfamily [Roseospirillum parvum]
MRRARRIAAGLLCLLAGACAPRLMPPGPGAPPDTPAPALQRNVFRTADGIPLFLRHWQAQGEEKAVVLALHGFNDHSGAFAGGPEVIGVGPFLADRGITVYAPDLRGFGTSPNAGLWPGVEALTRDLADLSWLIAARHPQSPLVLLGTSMGGATVLAALADPHPPPADKVVLIAPALRARSTLPPGLAIGLFLVAHSVPWYSATGEGLDIRPSDNLPMLRAMGRDPLVLKETRMDALWGLVNLMDAAFKSPPHLKGLPLLIAYGSHDDLVPEQPLRLFASRLPDPDIQTVRTYPGGWHMLLRDLNAEIPLADIATWITAGEVP